MFPLFLALAPLVMGGTLPTCTDTPLSCHATGTVTDTCCYNSPGGALVQVQLWDTDAGPSDSWTIHGLWPDYCDGDYGEYCDYSPEYDDVETLLEEQGLTDLLTYMETYWVSDDETAAEFWAHEWNAHGTCINTIEPSCYTDYTTGEEVGDFFQQVVTLFKGLDTYTALANAGITPSDTETYTAAEIQAALADIHGGYEVTLLCSDNKLESIYYYFNVYGSAVNGTYEPTTPLESSDCSSDAITYPVKTT
ncbi:hypothetical protein ASPZODRAFT_59078 [Penicilliopsis zonata CBS 506.65]|uniref:Uncharacterized protein n=1 Tax=Penicilliopsis zonata CBS 506.65 TaxID=1073090 RepID=A0A1L9ST22_9EURO|nr:hypothetical protein ASPZODRAFT_59078 [Penicilliopsis zonata CBS 506.65]OJJ50253.1 hypothetical protein ASPZODRAFT_59078 [Penicilliopsis zonata CBS 506.65]